MMRDVRVLKRQAKWLSEFAYADWKEIQTKAAREQLADMYATITRGTDRWEKPEPPLQKELQRFQKQMTTFFDRLAQGVAETLDVPERFVVERGNGGVVIRPVRGFELYTVDAVLVDIIRAYGDRFRACPVCGRGFFKFGRAQYCSHSCSDTGRRRVYRGKKSSARGATEESTLRLSPSPGSPRRRTRKGIPSFLVTKQVSPSSTPGGQEAAQEAGGRLDPSGIDAILHDVAAYLKPFAEYWLPHGDEAADAVQRVLNDLWRVLKAGRVIKNPKAYAKTCLKRASTHVLRDRASREVS
jgi:hypothetical protein